MPSSALAVVSTAVLLAAVLVADDDTHNDYRRMHIDTADTLYVCRLILNVRVRAALSRNAQTSTPLLLSSSIRIDGKCSTIRDYITTGHHVRTLPSDTAHGVPKCVVPPIHVYPNAHVRSIMFRPAHDYRRHISP